ncbi:MAG TPA: UvrD-helicase domain-containing protein [Clostridia bacterium]
MSDFKYENIIKSSNLNEKFVIKGPTGSGKSSVLLERYLYMVQEMKVPSERILILLMNRMQSLEWRKKTLLKSSGAIWRTSYYGFIQSEIKTYYPLVLKNCSEIGLKRGKPVFLTFEPVQFLVSRVIEVQRERKGIFAGVTSFADRIAIDLTSNLVKAATSDIPYKEIGTRLYNSLEHKDEIKRKIFKDGDEILEAYRKKCLELGIFDFGMAVDIYNNCLLSDDEYKNQLFKRVDYLMVDNTEECVPSEIDFIRMMIKNVKGCWITYNDEGGYGEAFGGNHEYAKGLLDILESVELEKPYTCNDFMSEFSDMLYEKIENNHTLKYEKKPVIERIRPFDLRSEMLENIGERVAGLVLDEGYAPSDIVILSTYADPVTEFVIGRILEKKEIYIKNLARRSRIIDNPFSQALVTLAQLCHPTYGMLPGRDDVKSLIRLLLKIDPVRSSLLAGEVCSQRPYAEFPDIEFPGLVERIGYYNIEKYEYIREWIREYRTYKNPLPINEFLQKVFLEVLISKEVTDSDILQAKNLIDSAQTFVDVVTRFNRNANRDFLFMVKGGIKSSESLFEIEEKLDGDFVLISTPVAFLSGSLKSKVVILSSLSSKNWTPRSMKELTNNHVLTKTWDTSCVYTEEMELMKQKHYLAVITRAILKRCSDKVITFESMLSASGYENNGILSDYFDELII